MILLDTNALIWMKSDPERLSKSAKNAIREAANKDCVAISAYTLWEVAWLSVRGRLRLHGPLSAVLEQVVSGVKVVPLTPEIAAVGASFPESFPRDPADRIIAATALTETVPLVTADQTIRRSAVVKTIW